VERRDEYVLSPCSDDPSVYLGEDLDPGADVLEEG